MNLHTDPKSFTMTVRFTGRLRLVGWLLATIWTAVPVLSAASPEADKVSPFDQDDVSFMMFGDPPIEFLDDRRIASGLTKYDLPSAGEGTIARQLGMARLLMLDIQRGYSLRPGQAETIASHLSQLNQSLPGNASQQRPLKQLLISLLLVSDASEQADVLWESVQDDPVAQLLVMREMVRWKSSSPRDTWRQWLANPDSDPQSTALALDGIAATGDASDVRLAEQWLSDARDSVVQLAAARALANLRPEGNLPLAESLYQQSQQAQSDVLPTMAAELLRRDPRLDAHRLLAKIVRDDRSETAVATAMSVLRQTATVGAVRLATAMPKHNSRLVRSQAIKILTDNDQAFTSKDQPKVVQALLGFLSDPEAEHRAKARRALVRLARRGDQRVAVLRGFVLALRQEAWQPKEQAIIGLADLGESRAVPELIGLLDDSQRHLSVSSAWALRRLMPGMNTAQQAATVKVIQNKLLDWVDSNRQPPMTAHTPDDKHWAAHLIEALGEAGDPSSADLLTPMVPKNAPYHALPRAAAIWALGKIYGQQAPVDLTSMVKSRASDTEGEEPENQLVVYASVLALGRFGQASDAEFLQGVAAGLDSKPPRNRAAAWALSQLQQ